jgi:hypothetical protein
MTTKKTVRFNTEEDISPIIFQELEEDSGTDYEEEKEDPRETLKKLIKGRSFGKEEFGTDYESNADLKRQVEISFNNLNKKPTTMVIPDFKSLRDTTQIDEKNDIPKIVGKDHDKNLQPCPDCSELMHVTYNNCQVCSRETVDVRCTNCTPHLFDLCSPKCREIYEGGTSVIEITNDFDEPIVIIEDDGQNMVLTVVNHKLFYQELNQKDSLMINKPCPNCNNSDKESEHEHENEEDDDEVTDKIKIGVIPVKCYSCSTNYSYLVVCGVCYHKSGMKYLCDECDACF